MRAVFGGGLIDGASRDSIECGAFCSSKRHLAAHSAAGRPARMIAGLAPAASEWNTFDTGGVCPGVPSPVDFNPVPQVWQLVRWPTGERQIRHSQARSAVFPYQAMKLVSEGEDRSGGRDNRRTAAEESTLLEPCRPSNPWKGSGDLLGGEASALTMVRGPSQPSRRSMSAAARPALTVGGPYNGWFRQIEEKTLHSRLFRFESALLVVN